ncbi:MAG: hypothetical protein ACRCVU_14030 [Flavobacterium sp.]
MSDMFEGLMGDTAPVDMNSLVSEQVAAPITSVGSNKSAAAHVALLEGNPDNTLNTYNEILDERNTQGISLKEDEITSTTRAQEVYSRKRTVSEILLDTTVPDDVKLSAFQNANNTDSPDLGVKHMVATRSAAAPNKGESLESEKQRDYLGAAIGNVLAYQGQMQQVYNEMKQKESASTGGAVAAVEAFIPLMTGFKEAERAKKFDETYGSGFVDTLKRAVMPGSSRKDRADVFNRLPLAQRQAVVDRFVSTLEEDGQSILLPDSMDAPSLAELQTMTESGAYTTGDKYVDNAFEALDAAGVVGSLISGLKRAAGLGKGLSSLGSSELADAWAKRVVASDVQPSSVSQTVKDVNPEQARQLHALADVDTTGDAALTTHGTTRDQAIAGDVLPVIGEESGRVPSKVYNPQRVHDMTVGLETEPSILARVNDVGFSYMSDAEKASAKANVVNDFQNVVGFTNRAEMSSIQATDSGMKMSQIYGPANGGFGSVDDAITQAAFAMRKYGITSDNLKVLKYENGDYVPLKVGEQGGDNLLVQVDYNYRFNMDDVDALEEYTVKNNWFDRANLGSTGSNGSLQQHLLDPQSMLDPRLTHSFTAALGNAAGVQREFLRSAAEMGKRFRGMKFERQRAINDELINANLRSEELTENYLKGKGYDSNEIAVFKDFRRIQDTIFELDDMDLKTSLRNSGYQIMENGKTDTRLFVKPLSQSSLGGHVRAYDPDLARMVDLSDDELKQLYKSGSGIGKMRSHMNIDDEIVENIVHYNSPDGHYLRAINDNDKALSYRKGYYSVRYTDPHFIDKKIVDKNGKSITKAVGTAGNMKDANLMAERLRKTDGAEYIVRAEKNRDINVDSVFDSHHAGGRSSQRVRGLRLEDSTGANDMNPMDAANIQTPLESMVRSIRSISDRVAMRDVIDAQKQRFVAQYGDVLTQKGRFPEAATGIHAEDYASRKMAGDARTAYNYIRSIEHGYRNALDDSVKHLLHAMADGVGAKGFSKAEEAIRAATEGAGITGVGKKAVYTFLIALSPLRQLMLQSAQGSLLLAHNASYVTTRLIPDMFLVYGHHLGMKPSKALLAASGKTEAEAAKMLDALDRSNIAAGISQNTLAREAFDGIVDDMFKSRAKTGLRQARTGARKIAEYSRKVGFDLGEFNSSASSFLSHYDKAIKNGRVMDKAGIEKTMAESRNFTFNMDRAGQMPYERNSVALITQFLQVPHKAMTLLAFNRTLSKSDRFKVAATATLLYGAPDELIDNYMSPLLEGLDEPQKEAIKGGLFQAGANYMLTKASGQDTEIDFSSFNPFDGYGLIDFVARIGEEGLGGIISGSPAGSMLFGTNPRITDLARVTGKWLGVVDDAEANPTTAMQVMTATASLASGYSYLLKSHMALRYGKLYGAGGQVQDGNVSTPEAYALLLGLSTMDAKRLRDESFRAKEKTKEREQAGKDAAVFVRKQVFMSEGDPQQFQYGTAIGNYVSNAIKEDPIAYKAYLNEFRKGFTSPEDKFGQLMMQGMGVMKADDFNRLVDANPSLTPEGKAEIKELHKSLTSKEKE